jgi:hypothetical protein
LDRALAIDAEERSRVFEDADVGDGTLLIADDATRRGLEVN